MSSPNSRRTAFILDFDGTITTKDTTATIAQFAISAQKSRGHDITGAWQDIITKYSQDYKTYVESYSPSKSDRDGLQEEIAFLRGLREVELKSFERVSISGMFKGIGDGDWQDAGREAVQNGEVEVRAGFVEFVERVEKIRGTWGVVSVNFSTSFIRGVLHASVGGPKSAAVEVLANSLDERGVLRGAQLPDGEYLMATSDAKLASMKFILQSWNVSGDEGSWKIEYPRVESRQEERFSRVVYVGDSETDIECLIKNGVIGIVISNDSKNALTETMHRVGVALVHICDHRDNDEKLVYRARDFTEIIRSQLLQ